MSIDRIVGEALCAGRPASQHDLERTTRDILKFVPVSTPTGHLAEIDSRITHVLDAIGVYELRIHWLKADLRATRSKYRWALVAVALCAWLVVAAAYGSAVLRYVTGG